MPELRKGTGDMMEEGALEKLIAKFYQKIKQRIAPYTKCLVIDFQNEIDTFSPELGDGVLSDPINFIDELKKCAQATNENLIIRLKNLPETQKVQLSDISQRHVGALIEVEGSVKSTGRAREERVFAVEYECQACGHQLTLKQNMIDNKRVRPAICSNCGKKSHFKRISEHKKDMLIATISDLAEDPVKGIEQINLLLFEDLAGPDMVKMLLPGRKLRVTAWVKDQTIAHRELDKMFYLEGMWVEPGVGNEYDAIEITKEDEEKILELAKDPALYLKLRECVAPHLFGTDAIRDAIILQQFGGIRRAKEDGTVDRRGDIHILLVGGPGLAKSALLKYVSKMAPKARYVVAAGATAVGLTAAVVTNEMTGSYTAEAGPLPLMNRGLVAIDELDKMDKEEIAKLNEALAQQTISVNRANVSRTFISQTAIFAAANPKNGRFNSFTRLPEQIDLDPTTIDRFDLIFIIRDINDENTDTAIADKILNLQGELKKETAIPLPLLRKYIAYGRRNCEPELTPEISAKIRDLYIRVKYPHNGTLQDSMDSIRNFSPRHLESIIRLAEARARARLAKYITIEDLQAVHALMQNYLHECGLDPDTGEIDTDAVIGMPHSQQNAIAAVLSIIKQLQVGEQNGVFAMRIFTEAKRYKIDDAMVEKALGILHDKGEIIEPMKNYYRSC